MRLVGVSHYFNPARICGTLAGVEMGLDLAGVPHKPAGVTAAMEHLAATSDGTQK